MVNSLSGSQKFIGGRAQTKWSPETTDSQTPGTNSSAQMKHMYKDTLENAPEDGGGRQEFVGEFVGRSLRQRMSAVRTILGGILECILIFIT